MNPKEIATCIAAADRLKEEGRYAEAEDGYLQAFRSLHCNVSPATSSVLNKLGIVRQALGDLTGAQQYYAQALEVIEDHGAGTELDEAVVYQNLAVLENSRARFAVAESYAIRAIEIRERLLHGVQESAVEASVMLADSLLGQNRGAEAKPLYERGAAHLSGSQQEHCLRALRIIESDRA